MFLITTSEVHKVVMTRKRMDAAKASGGSAVLSSTCDQVLFVDVGPGDKNNCIMIERCVQSRTTNVRPELRLA